MQTGKATPAPVVLLDVPGRTYWKGGDVRRRRAGRAGLGSPGDDNWLYTITDDVDEAVEAILGFWRNYQSIRWVGDAWSSACGATRPPTRWRRPRCEFADLLLDGRIEATEPLGAESPTAARSTAWLVCASTLARVAGSTALIRALNGLARAPRLSRQTGRLPP